MKLKLLLCLFAALTTVRAANYVGDQTFAAPFTLNEGVNIVGNLTLSTPGTYAASNWNVVGLVRFSAPGNYTVTATGSGISFAGNVLGPANGTVVVRVGYRTTVNVVGQVANNITVIDDSRALPPSDSEVVSSPPAAPLMNLSTRVTLPAGGVLNPGFVIGGDKPRRVLIRAIGPGLAQFGVRGTLADPRLEVFNGALAIATNEDWAASAQLNAVFAAVGAFGLPSGSKDAAIVLTLTPGAYTVTVSGTTSADAGEVLFEVYFLE